ncbi:MAG: hypothetical protein BGO68_00690 [Candidatus Amoebophilus sp. 36-38]|nr:MAG: hypothetical protein BGO68_00690 [Candidatus Amoebophilus sp. 36-38]
MEEALYTKNISFELVLEELKTLLQQNDIQIPPIDIQTDLAYPHLIDTTDSQLVFKELPFPPHYPRLVPSSAGIFASLDATIEIYKLCFGYRPEILSRESLAHLQTPIKKNYDIHKWNLKWSYDTAQVESYYGLGWRILKAKTHPHTDLICHSGYIAGINTFIGHIPSHEVGIIILINQDSGFATQEGFKFWAQFLK